MMIELLQMEEVVSLWQRLAELGAVVIVLLLAIYFLWKENKELKADNKELQNELKEEIKSTTSFVEQLKSLLQSFKES